MKKIVIVDQLFDPTEGDEADDFPDPTCRHCEGSKIDPLDGGQCGECRGTGSNDE